MFAAALSLAGVAAAQAAVSDAPMAAHDALGDTPAPVARLAAPVAPLRAIRLFDPPPQPWNSGHRGIDMRSTPAARVFSPWDGTVAFVGQVVDRPVLSIDLDVGLRSTFEPVESQLQPGTRVGRGEEVGTVADSAVMSHCDPSTCVHWGLRRGDLYVNPLDWLEGFGPIQLLPVSPT